MIAKFFKAIRRAQKDRIVATEISAEDAARLIVASAYTATQVKFTAHRRKSARRFIDHVIKLALHP